MKFVSKSSDLSRGKMRVVMENNERDFPLAACFVKLVNVHRHIII